MAAAKIPEILINKMVLMSYELQPHPLATIINDAFMDEGLKFVEFFIESRGWSEEYMMRNEKAEFVMRYKWYKMFDLIHEYMNYFEQHPKKL